MGTMAVDEVGHHPLETTVATASVVLATNLIFKVDQIVERVLADREALLMAEVQVVLADQGVLHLAEVPVVLVVEDQRNLSVNYLRYFLFKSDLLLIFLSIEFKKEAK